MSEHELRKLRRMTLGVAALAVLVIGGTIAVLVGQSRGGGPELDLPEMEQPAMGQLEVPDIELGAERGKREPEGLEAADGDEADEAEDVADPAAQEAEAPVAGETLEPTAQGSEERKTLDRAEAALRDGKAVRALAILDAYNQRFMDGELHERASAIYVLALCGAGRVDDAKEAARAFGRGFPESTYRTRIDASCVTR